MQMIAKTVCLTSWVSITSIALQAAITVN